jgi:hypothetical protein
MRSHATTLSLVCTWKSQLTRGIVPLTNTRSRDNTLSRLEKSAHAWDCSTHQHAVTRQLSLSSGKVRSFVWRGVVCVVFEFVSLSVCLLVKNPDCWKESWPLSDRYLIVIWKLSESWKLFWKLRFLSLSERSKIILLNGLEPAGPIAH